MLEVHAAADSFDVCGRRRSCAQDGMKSMRRTQPVSFSRNGSEDEGVGRDNLRGGFFQRRRRTDCPVAVFLGAESEAGTRGGEKSGQQSQSMSRRDDQGSGFTVADEGVVSIFEALDRETFTS